MLRKLRFFEFAKELISEGATMKDVYRLDREGRENAVDAFGELWHEGKMPEIKDENSFKSFCVHMGRQFVLDNLDVDGLGDDGLFTIKEG